METSAFFEFIQLVVAGDRRTSNRDPRVLVVWGATVLSARSLSSARTLTTRQGRTFATMPRSTSQTSLRSGCFTGILLLVET